MYEHSAAYYDLLYRDLKDYSAEALRIHHLLQACQPAPNRLLDVACGTGEHARQLSKLHPYQIDGIDLQTGFIEIAARKNPSGRFQVEDMRDFALGRSYDAILCLFSSIGYVETLEGLNNTLRCFARHINPGGVLLCEPWVEPSRWIPGLEDVVEAEDPQKGISVKRIRRGRSEGEISLLDIEYQVTRNGKTEILRETHRLGLFEREVFDDCLEQAGFVGSWSEDEQSGNRILLARKVS